MESQKLIVLARRFARTLIAILIGAVVTGIGTIGVYLSQGHTITSLQDLRQLGLSLVPVFSIAFFGALAAALDKLRRYVEPETES